MRERQQTDGFKWYISHITEAMGSASITSKGMVFIEIPAFEGESFESVVSKIDFGNFGWKLIKIRLNKITNIYTLSLGELR